MYCMCARVQRRLQHEMCALKWVTFSSHNRPQKQKQRIDRALTESLIFPIWWFPFHAKVPEVSYGFEWICTLCTHRLNRSVCLNRNWTLSSDFRHFDLASDSIFIHTYVVVHSSGPQKRKCWGKEDADSFEFEIDLKFERANTFWYRTLACFNASPDVREWNSLES